MPKRHVNAGLVGFGLSGRIFHAPFIHAHPYLQLAAVVERHHETSRERYPYVNIVRSLEALLADDSIELIVITVPNRHHFSLARQALEGNRHVVLEKPLTVTTAEADTLITLARERNKLLSVYQNRRWDGDFRTVQQLMATGRLGDVVDYEARFERYSPSRPDAWRERDEPGAGILYDLGSHLIDQALVLFGSPRAVYADIRRQRPGSRVDDYFALDLDYGSLRARLQAGMLVREPGPHFALHGTRGSFVSYGMDPQEEALKAGHTPDEPGFGSDPDCPRATLLAKSGNREHVPIRPGAYARYYENVYQCITGDAAPEVRAEDAREVIRIIELAFDSHASGQKLS